MGKLPWGPKTFTTTVHSGFRKARVGLGLIFGRDQIGVHTETSLFGAYSYKLPLSEQNSSSITFGIQGGFNDLKSDYGSLSPKDPDVFGTLKKLNPNFGVGVYYRNDRAYIGASAPYLLNNRIIDSDVMQGSTAREFRYYYLMGGFTKKITSDFKIVPSTQIRIQERAPVSVDVNFIGVIHDVVGLGASWRLGDSVVGLFEVQINDNFHVGYGYDFTTSDLRRYSNGSHEIMLNYRVKIRYLHKGLECPTYW